MSESTESSRRPSLPSSTSGSTLSPATTPSSEQGAFTSQKPRKYRHHHHHHGPLHTLRHALRDVDILLSITPDRLQAFARDIWAVAIGLRGAHLIDCCHFKERDLTSLAAVFTNLDLEPLLDLVIIFEPMTEQTFICNAEVLGQRVRDGLAQSPHYLKSWFVRIDGDTPELMECCSSKIIALLTELSHLMCQNRHRQPGALPIARLDFLRGLDYPERKLVTIAGVILGFPVVYVLPPPEDGASTSKNALAHTPLYVCKVWLQGEKKHDDHVLLQCTFPATIFRYDVAETIDPDAATPGVCTVREVTAVANKMVLEQLDEAQARGWTCLWHDVVVEVEGPITLDRVAL